MNNQIKYGTLGLLLIIIQILISEFLNVWPFLYISVFPLFLLILPYEIKTPVLMLIGFGLGLAADLLADGIPGLNASGCVAAAFFRTPLLRLQLTRSNMENHVAIDCRGIGILRFLLLCLTMYAVFFLFYIPLDGIGSISWTYNLFRFIIGTAANTVLALILELFLVNQVVR